MTPAQRTLLDAATRGPIQPSPRQLQTAAVLAERGWLELQSDGLRFTLTELGWVAHANELSPLQHNERVVANWELARERRRANVGR